MHRSSAHWHPTAQRYTYRVDNGWMRSSTDDDDGISSHRTANDALLKSRAVPNLEFLNFSDDRTALVKLRGADGKQRYVSVLRLDPSSHDNSSENARPSMHINDGWCIVREVVQSNCDTATEPKNGTSWITTLPAALHDYLSIEHGGGLADGNKAKQLFHPEASLASVGTASVDDSPSDWSSPSGSLLDISLNTYFKGIQSQTPHGEECKAYDAIVQLDTIAPSAAAATVRVGNGACDTLFVDHLLLGHHEDRWRILCKVFSCRPYPK